MSQLLQKSVPDAVSRRALLSRLTFTLPGMLYTLVFMIIPLGFIFTYSFMQRGVYGGVVPTLNIDNYTRALDSIYIKVLINSIVVALSATVLALAIGYPTAYAITRLPKRLQSIFLILMEWCTRLVSHQRQRLAESS